MEREGFLGVSYRSKKRAVDVPSRRWRWVHNTCPEDIVNSFKRHDVTAVILFRVPICIQSYPFGRFSAFTASSSPLPPFFHWRYHRWITGVSRPIASLRDQNVRVLAIQLFRWFVCLFAEFSIHYIALCRGGFIPVWSRIAIEVNFWERWQAITKLAFGNCQATR